MKAIRDFLREILTPQMVWVDESQQGHWVQKKRMHPVLRAFIGGGVAIIVAVFAVSYFRSAPGPEEPLPAPQEAPLTAEKPDLPAPVSPDEGVTIPQPGSLAVLSPDWEPTAPLAVVPESVRPSITPDAPAGKITPKPEEPRPTLEIKLKPKKEQPTPKEPVKPEAPTPPGRRKDYWIQIDKGSYTLSLYKGQDVVKTYSIAVGKNPGNKQAIGDHRTPVGNFRVISIEDASKWKHDFGDGKGKIDGAYGPWFIRLDAGGWKGIGIHGTHDPDSRGTMATEGCIRLSNEEIQDLKRYAYRNMRVVIRE